MNKNGMTAKDFFGLAFGSMIGIGWVVSIPVWMSTAGSIGAVIAVIATMLLIIPIGFVYGELTASLKVSGGEFAYTFKALGKFPAFICGWFLIMGYVIMLPWVAISVAALMGYLFPALNTIPLYTILDYQVYLPQLLVSLVMVGSITYMNWRGTQQSSAFQNIATAMMIIVFIVFLFGGATMGSSTNIEPFFNEGSIVNSIALAMASILMFMNGFDTIPKTVEEANSSINYSNLGKVIVGTILSGGILYILIIIVASFIMPAEQMVRFGELPLISALEVTSGSKFMPVIVAFGAILGVITTFNGFLLAGSRLVASFSKSGFLPKALSKEHPKYKTPTNALMFITTISIIGILLGRGILLPFIVMGGIAFLIAWFCVSLSSVMLKGKYPDLHRPFKVPGGNMTRYVATIFSGLFLLLMIIPGTPISMGKIEYILFGVWVVIGLAIYGFYCKKDIQIQELKSRKETIGKNEIINEKQMTINR